EARDLPADPLEGGDLVEEPLVPARGQLRAERRAREPEEAEDTQTVVDRDDDDVPAPRERSTVERGLRAAADDEGAALNPSQHGPAPRVCVGGPDVQRETLLGAGGLVEAHDRTDQIGSLGRRGTEPGSVAHTWPWLGELGRYEAQGAAR